MSRALTRFFRSSFLTVQFRAPVTLNIKHRIRRSLKSSIQFKYLARLVHRKFDALARMFPVNFPPPSFVADSNMTALRSSWCLVFLSPSLFDYKRLRLNTCFGIDSVDSSLSIATEDAIQYFSPGLIHECSSPAIE